MGDFSCSIRQRGSRDVSGLDEKVNFINSQVKLYKKEVTIPKKINKSEMFLKFHNNTRES